MVLELRDTPRQRLSRRSRAVLLDIATIVASLPINYVLILIKGGRVTTDEYLAQLRYMLPLSLLVCLARRLTQGLGRGTKEEYDYGRMNPRGFFKSSDVLSPVPHIAWERHPGQVAFFEGVIGRGRFIDTPGLALSVAWEGDEASAMERLRSFREAAVHWDEHANSVHAVFDAPPPSTNRWTADYGARMWAAVASDGEGSVRVRVVFGSGGFGQGQVAGVLAGLVPVSWFPEAALAWALDVEQELRGAVGWWILVGRVLGVEDEHFEHAHGGGLQIQAARAVATSLASRDTLRAVKWAVLVFLGVVLLLPLVITLAAALLS